MILMNILYLFLKRYSLKDTDDEYSNFAVKLKDKGRFRQR